VTIAAGALVETFAGGTALVHGAVHNSGGTLFASGASSLIEILSGTVVSGGLVEIGNGTIDVRSGGTATSSHRPAAAASSSPTRPARQRPIPARSPASAA